jgi:hypothetical protein
MATVFALIVLHPMIHPARASRGDLIVVQPGRGLAVVRDVDGRPVVRFRGPPMVHMLKELVRCGITRPLTPADGVALLEAAPERRRVRQRPADYPPDAAAPPESE